MIYMNALPEGVLRYYPDAVSFLVQGVPGGEGGIRTRGTG